MRQSPNPVIPMMWILLSLVIVSTVTVNVKYLAGVRRLNTDGTDYYFSCNVVGEYLHWEHNNNSLTFRIEDTGSVVVTPRSMYELTATLLSSQFDPETNQTSLDSVLVLSFTGDHPSLFEVTCSSNSNSTTTHVAGLHGNTTSNSSSNGEVVLNHIISAEIVQIENITTHIFICGAENDQQYYEIQGGSAIGFTKHDDIGQARTDLSQAGNRVNIQSVLIADHPYQKISLLFITEYSDVTVTCFFDTNQTMLNSKVSTMEFSDPLPTSSHYTAPMTAGSPASHATTALSSTTPKIFSTTFETGNTIFIGSLNIAVVIAAVVVAVAVLLGVLVCIAMLIMLAIAVKGQKSIGSHQSRKVLSIEMSEDSAYQGSCSTVKSSDRTSSGQHVSLNMGSESCQTTQNLPMETDLNGKSEQTCSDKSASSCRHACQSSVEESSSGEDPLRVCESLIYLLGHEHGSSEPVKSFVSLQEMPFIGADGLWQDCFDSVSENVCPVYLPFTDFSFKCPVCGYSFT